MLHEHPTAHAQELRARFPSDFVDELKDGAVNARKRVLMAAEVEKARQKWRRASAKILANPCLELILKSRRSFIVIAKKQIIRFDRAKLALKRQTICFTYVRGL